MLLPQEISNNKFVAFADRSLKQFMHIDTLSFILQLDAREHIQIIEKVTIESSDFYLLVIVGLTLLTRKTLGQT